MAHSCWGDPRLVVAHIGIMTAPNRVGIGGCNRRHLLPRIAASLFDTSFGQVRRSQIHVRLRATTVGVYQMGTSRVSVESKRGGPRGPMGEGWVSFRDIAPLTQATAREYSQSPSPRARLARRLWRPASRPPAHALDVYHLTLFGFNRWLHQGGDEPPRTINKKARSSSSATYCESVLISVQSTGGAPGQLAWRVYRPIDGAMRAAIA